MLLSPIQQEVMMAMMLMGFVLIVFIFIGVIVGWFARKQGVGSVVPRVLGVLLSGVPFAIAVGAMVLAVPYNFPEAFFTQGIFLCAAAICIAVGNAIAEKARNQENEKPDALKGSWWIFINNAAAIISGYILWSIGWGGVPVMLLAVAAAQWLLLRRVVPVSPWWLLGGLLASLGYITGLIGNLSLGYYIGGILMVGLQWFLLKLHNPKGAFLFAGAMLLGWLTIGSFFDYIPGSTLTYDRSPDEFFVPFDMLMLSYYGLVIIWSSLLVGLVADRIVRPKVEMQPASEPQSGADE